MLFDNNDAMMNVIRRLIRVFFVPAVNLKSTAAEIVCLRGFSVEQHGSTNEHNWQMYRSGFICRVLILFAIKRKKRGVNIDRLSNADGVAS